MKIRVKFTKHGPVRYVGHLDMMRYFQKALRRAGTDVSYSEGFSPHPIISFASPLGVGMESDAEYFDLQVESSLSSQEEIRRLNAQMAEGVEIISWKKLPDQAKKAMTVTAAIDYQIFFREGHKLPCGMDELVEKLEAFLDQKEILVLKKTKKREFETDLRPLILHAKVRTEDGRPYLSARLCSESGNSLNTKLFLSTFCSFCGAEYDPLAYRITRCEVLSKEIKEDGTIRYLPLEAAGEPIEENIS